MAEWDNTTHPTEIIQETYVISDLPGSSLGLERLLPSCSPNTMHPLSSIPLCQSTGLHHKNHITNPIIPSPTSIVVNRPHAFCQLAIGNDAIVLKNRSTPAI